MGFHSRFHRGPRGPPLERGRGAGTGLGGQAQQEAAHEATGHHDVPLDEVCRLGGRGGGGRGGGRDRNEDIMAGFGTSSVQHFNSSLSVGE